VTDKRIYKIEAHNFKFFTKINNWCYLKEDSSAWYECIAAVAISV